MYCTFIDFFFYSFLYRTRKVKEYFYCRFSWISNARNLIVLQGSKATQFVIEIRTFVIPVANGSTLRETFDIRNLNCVSSRNLQVVYGFVILVCNWVALILISGKTRLSLQQVGIHQALSFPLLFSSPILFELNLISCKVNELHCRVAKV